MKVKKLFEDSILPERAHPTDSGMDVFVHNIKGYPILAETIAPGEILKIGTGIACAVEKGFEIQVRPKSGLASKYGLTVINTPGTIDQSYRGEIIIAIINLSNSIYTLQRDQKIAQLVVAPVVLCEVEEVAELDETVRGAGGFGSTGASVRG